MSKVVHTTYVLSTVSHDGRYIGDKGQNGLADHVANRLWSLDGVSHVQSNLVKTIGDYFIRLPKWRFEELVKAEQKLKDVTDV